MAIYYPSLVFNFHLRFDETLIAQILAEPTSADQLKDKGTADAPPPSDRPEAFSQTSDSFVVYRVPRQARIELPGYRQAATFDAVFDYKDLPIDPQILRAASVDVYLDTVPSSDFGVGMVETLPAPGTIKIPPRRRSLLEPRFPQGTDPGNLIFAGTVDKSTMEFSDGSAIVHVTGRDLRGIFLDTPTVPSDLFGKLDVKQPIDKVIQQVIDTHPAFGKSGPGLTVWTNPDDWVAFAAGPKDESGRPVVANIGIPSPGDPSILPRVRRGADGKQARIGPPGGSLRITYWDLITQLCYLVGAIPYFLGTQRLVIRPARSIFDETKLAGFDPAVPTPFQDGALRMVTSGDPPTKESINYRRMVYGRDIETLKYERKYAGQKVQIVQCVSFDPDANKVVTGQWPTDESYLSQKQITAAKRTRNYPSNKVTESDYFRVPVHGVKDPARLNELAKGIFEELGRGEMGGSCSTKSLASFGGGNDDADLIRLRPGDPVAIRVDVSPLSETTQVTSELTEDVRRSPDAQIKAVLSRVGDQNLARAIVASQRGNVQRLFRVCNVAYSYNGGALAVDFDFQNYITARYGILKGQGENQARPTSAPTGRKGSI